MIAAAVITSGLINDAKAVLKKRFFWAKTRKSWLFLRESQVFLTVSVTANKICG